MKKLMIVLAGLALAGCKIGSLPAPPSALEITAPARATTIDEQGVKLAFDAFDTALKAVDGLIAAGVIEPGSPKALQLRALLFRVKAALNAAASAQRASNAESYAAAMADAKAAYVSIQATLKGVDQ